MRIGLRPALCHRLLVSHAVRSTKLPSGTIRPVSSAIEMNCAGCTRPSSGCFHRTSASIPTILLLAMSTREPEDGMPEELAAEIRRLAWWAQYEDMRREQQRIVFKAPPEAEVVIVVRARLATMDSDLSDAKWWVPDAVIKFKNGGTKQKDPVSDSGFAVETVKTRAARRVLRLIIGRLEMTNPTRAAVERAESSLKQLDPMFENARIRQTMEAAEAMKRRASAAFAPTDPNDPYALGAATAPKALAAGAVVTDDGRPATHGTYEAPVRAATVPTLDPSRAAATLAQPDPFGHTSPAQTPAAAAAPATPPPLADDDFDSFVQ